MQPIIVVHIVMGSLGILSGFFALYASKGAPLHRRAGMLFVAVMLAMCTTGTIMAVAMNKAPAANIPAGVMTAYLVVTGLTTVRPPARGALALQIGVTLVALTVGVVACTFGFEAIANGGTRRGMPAFPFFMFGAIGVLGSIGDLRMMRTRGIRGVSRLTRHLWRMTLALLIATLSFFIGQADVFPKPYRIYPLLALPVLAVLATLLYWVWRVRIRQIVRGTLVLRAPEAVSNPPQVTQ